MRRLREWLARYGLAELAGIACALVASTIVRHLTGNAIFTAYAGAWGETVGYSAAILARELHGGHVGVTRSERFTVRRIRTMLVDLAHEFGPAGALDTFVVRPLCMGIGQRTLGPTRGLIVGKFAADVVFYIPVIVMYERRKLVRRH
jgi:hypothetical protein